jgi:hypothetical protein
MDNGMLTQTLKIKRPVVTQHYRDMIDGMFWRYSQGIRNRDKRQGIEEWGQAEG